MVRSNVAEKNSGKTSLLQDHFKDKNSAVDDQESAGLRRAYSWALYIVSVQKMNVVHVNTHDVGGAAMAAHRLHSDLLDHGINSKFLVLFNSRKFSDVETFSPLKRSFLLARMKNKILGNSNKEIQRFILENRKVEMFSSPDTLYDLTTNPLIREADIIHLHWVSNFLDYPTFFGKEKKPIVWTFHDENPLMGGCHYSDDAQFLSAELKNNANAL